MNLHDQLYLRITEEEPFRQVVWEPRGLAVVIGHSQVAEREVYLENCRADAVPVIRRRGGGGAVVLMPGVVCLTVAFNSRQSESPYFFFNKINAFLVDMLSARFLLHGLALKGISDIALEGRKILGCSMFKSRQLFFYQGSLLVRPDLQRIDRYLRHPSQEPDYRQGRGHGAFVTSLWESGYRLEIAQLKEALQQSSAALKGILL